MKGTVLTHRLFPALGLVLLVAPGCPAPPPPPLGGEGEGEGEPPPPPALCTAPLAPVDTTGAMEVTNCTEQGLDEALAALTSAGGGALRFACGGPVTIPLATEKLVTVDLVLDGAGEVTIEGLGANRLLRLGSTFDVETPTLTVQNLTFRGGRAFGTDLQGGGGAIFREGGTLEVIDSHFIDNRGNVDGQDTAGGAIFSLGVGDTLVVGSTFSQNSASNGGALGNLGNDLYVVNSTFEDNAATGSGGNPGNGGNGGTVSVDGEDREVALCGVSIARSTANAFGGAVFRVAYRFTEPTTFDRVRITGGHIDDRDPSMGGGVYLQGTAVAMRASTLDNNEARAAGGAYFGPGASVFLENTSFLANTALSSLAGGMFLDGVTSGALENVTLAGNAAPGEVAFGGAITGNGAPLQMRNTLVLGSVAGNGFNPISCTTALSSGAGSFQFPVARAGGGSDDPDALCAPDIAAQEVVFGAVIEEDGIAFVEPDAASPAVGAGVDCPATDARGAPRPAQGCTSGAVERAP